MATPATSLFDRATAAAKRALGIDDEETQALEEQRRQETLRRQALGTPTLSGMPPTPAQIGRQQLDTALTEAAGTVQTPPATPAQALANLFGVGTVDTTPIVAGPVDNPTVIPGPQAPIPALGLLTGQSGPGDSAPAQVEDPARLVATRFADSSIAPAPSFARQNEIDLVQGMLDPLGAGVQSVRNALTRSGVRPAPAVNPTPEDPASPAIDLLGSLVRGVAMPVDPETGMPNIDVAGGPLMGVPGKARNVLDDAAKAARRAKAAEGAAEVVEGAADPTLGQQMAKLSARERGLQKTVRKNVENGMFPDETTARRAQTDAITEVYGSKHGTTAEMLDKAQDVFENRKHELYALDVDSKPDPVMRHAAFLEYKRLIGPERMRLEQEVAEAPTAFAAAEAEERIDKLDETAQRLFGYASNMTSEAGQNLNWTKQLYGDAKNPADLKRRATRVAERTKGRKLDSDEIAGIAETTAQVNSARRKAKAVRTKAMDEALGALPGESNFRRRIDQLSRDSQTKVAEAIKSRIKSLKSELERRTNQAMTERSGFGQDMEPPSNPMTPEELALVADDPTVKTLNELVQNMRQQQTRKPLPDEFEAMRKRVLSQAERREAQLTRRLNGEPEIPRKDYTKVREKVEALPEVKDARKRITDLERQLAEQTTTRELGMFEGVGAMIRGSLLSGLDTLFIRNPGATYYDAVSRRLIADNVSYFTEAAMNLVKGAGGQSHASIWMGLNTPPTLGAPTSVAQLRELFDVKRAAKTGWEAVKTGVNPDTARALEELPRAVGDVKLSYGRVGQRIADTMLKYGERYGLGAVARPSAALVQQGSRAFNAAGEFIANAPLRVAGGFDAAMQSNFRETALRAAAEAHAREVGRLKGFDADEVAAFADDLVANPPASLVHSAVYRSQIDAFNNQAVVTKPGQGVLSNKSPLTRIAGGLTSVLSRPASTGNKVLDEIWGGIQLGARMQTGAHFLTTPINVAERMVEGYIPVVGVALSERKNEAVNAATAMQDTMRAQKAIREKGPQALANALDKAIDQIEDGRTRKAIADGIGANFNVAAQMALAAAAYKAGVLFLEPDTDMADAQGVPRLFARLNVGMDQPVVVDLSWAAPNSPTWAATIAGMREMEAIEDEVALAEREGIVRAATPGEDRMRVARTGALEVGASFAEMPLMSGPKNAFDTLTGRGLPPSDDIERTRSFNDRVKANFLRQAVPAGGLLRSIARTMDPIKRDTQDPRFPLTAGVREGIPGLRSDLAPKLSVTSGEPVRREPVVPGLLTFTKGTNDPLAKAISSVQGTVGKVRRKESEGETPETFKMREELTNRIRGDVMARVLRSNPRDTSKEYIDALDSDVTKLVNDKLTGLPLWTEWMPVLVDTLKQDPQMYDMVVQAWADSVNAKLTGLEAERPGKGDPTLVEKATQAARDKMTVSTPEDALRKQLLDLLR